MLGVVVYQSAPGPQTKDLQDKSREFLYVIAMMLSLPAKGTFMCPYKMEKSVYFILTPNIKKCVGEKTWLGKSVFL